MITQTRLNVTLYVNCLCCLLTQPHEAKPGQYFATGHESFLPRTSQFTIHKHPNPIHKLTTISFLNQKQMPSMMCSRSEFNYLVLNNAYAASQEARFKFLYDTAYASAYYGHSCTTLLSFSPCHH